MPGPESLTVILIAETQSEANGPWMLLKQLGYNNLKVMLGGWNYYANPIDPYDMPETPPYLNVARIEVSDLDAMLDFLGTDAGQEFVGSWSVYVDPQAIFTVGREV